MNYKSQVQLETHTVEDTQQFGQLLGKWVKQSGDPLCIALIQRSQLVNLQHTSVEGNA